MEKAAPGPKPAKAPSDDTLTTLAYKKIKDDIIRGQYRPGECLSSPRLARALRMSRTPVREALSMLANEGLVDIQNGVGIFIKELTRKELAEVYEVRLALECAAVEAIIMARGGAALESRPALKKLEREWALLKAKVRAGRLTDLDEVNQLDYKTHNFIVESGGNIFLSELVENLKLRIRHIQSLSVAAQGDVEDTIDQHLAIIANLRRGNLPETTRLLKLHIREAISYIFRDGTP